MLVLRVGGKRTLSKLNAFDLIITVALGSTLATVITSKQLPFAEGALCLVVLVALQFLVSWSARRFSTLSALVKNEPRLLFLRGQYLELALREERLQKEEIVQAMRSQGHSMLSEVEAVVLETDGSLSVVSNSSQAEVSTLCGIERAE